MILKYGSYSHASAEAAIAITQRKNYSQRGVPESVTKTWTITGILQADTQAAITTAIQALEAAYAINGQDLVLYLADGTTATAHALYSGQSIDGTRVLSLDYTEGEGVEYVNIRSYKIVVEAEFLASPENVTEYDETISFQGDGGPQRVFITTLTGAPVEQIGARQTTYKAFQQGSAVGLLGWPAPNAPIWPEAEHTPARVVNLKAPQRTGQGFKYYRTEWSYQFESIAPLAGTPNVV